jgi:hypothetical protein
VDNIKSLVYTTVQYTVRLILVRRGLPLTLQSLQIGNQSQFHRLESIKQQLFLEGLYIILQILGHLGQPSQQLRRGSQLQCQHLDSIKPQ